MGKSDIVTITVKEAPTPPVAHQVTVRVIDEKKRPLKGAKVSIYRRLPFSLVEEKYTDENGYAYFDGLWSWLYVMAADYEDKTTAPVCFNVELGKTYEFTLIARPPPHEYEMIINCGIEPIAKLEEWLVENVPLIRDTIIGFPHHEFVNAWVEGSNLHIRFRVTGSPFPWSAVGAILAILVALIILGWEIKEIIPEIPKEVWYLLGVGVAGAGIGALIYTIKKRR
jgi:hypothetical protein